MKELVMVYIGKQLAKETDPEDSRSIIQFKIDEAEAQLLGLQESQAEQLNKEMASLQDQFGKRGFKKPEESYIDVVKNELKELWDVSREVLSAQLKTAEGNLAGQKWLHGKRLE